MLAILLIVLNLSVKEKDNDCIKELNICRAKCYEINDTTGDCILKCYKKADECKI